jgi:hypothetical protein
MGRSSETAVKSSGLRSVTCQNIIPFNYCFVHVIAETDVPVSLPCLFIHFPLLSLQHWAPRSKEISCVHPHYRLVRPRVCDVFYYFICKFSVACVFSEAVVENEDKWSLWLPKFISEKSVKITCHKLPTLDRAFRYFSQSTQLQWFAARFTAAKEMATPRSKAKIVLWFKEIKYAKYIQLRYQTKLEWVHLVSHLFIEYISNNLC